jgi:hypothetical protein
MDYVFNNGFLTYASYEFTPVSYQEHAYSNLNLPSIGLGYKKEGKHWNWFAKAGYYFVHDSDMERYESITTSKTVQIKPKYRCNKPQYMEVSETRLNRTKISFSDGYGAEVGFGYKYPLEKWYIGLDVSGRWIRLGQEINDVSDDIDKFDAKGMLTVGFNF